MLLVYQGGSSCSETVWLGETNTVAASAGAGYSSALQVSLVE